MLPSLAIEISSLWGASARHAARNRRKASANHIKPVAEEEQPISALYATSDDDALDLVLELAHRARTVPTASQHNADARAANL